MAEAVYLLCAFASIACALLLLRKYRASRTEVLFWSSICFGGLALNNVLLFLDLVVFPNVDLMLLRNGSALAAVMALIFGLIWECK